MKRLKNTLIFGIILYYLIPLSVMAVTPEEVAAVGKSNRLPEYSSGSYARLLF